jgi:hypothetical protein
MFLLWPERLSAVVGSFAVANFDEAIFDEMALGPR